MPIHTIILALAALLAAGGAQAYVGPGAGLSLLGALWGLLAAIGAALLFLLIWPLRRMQRARRQRAEQAGQSADNNAQSGDAAQQSDAGTATSRSAPPRD